jgi:2Fe-2S ferredoxin
MTQVTIIDRAGNEQPVTAQNSQTLMEVVREHSFSELLALCGGCCSCATCHVYIDPAFAARLPPISADEDALLEGSSHRTEHSRLSCQIRIESAFDGLRATIAPED